MRKRVSVQAGEPVVRADAAGFLEVGMCCTKGPGLECSWCGWEESYCSEAHVPCRQVLGCGGSGDWGALR